MNNGGMKIVPHASDIPAELLLGRWVIWAHKWADTENITPLEWRRRTVAALEEAGVLFELRIMPDHDLTIIWNKLKPPSSVQLDNSIQEMLSRLDKERRERR